MKILFAGIIARYPFGGVTWCSLMYLLGLRALGHEVFYIEDTGECVYDPVLNTRSTDPAYGTNYIQNALDPENLTIHNLEIMSRAGLERLTPRDLVRSSDAFPFGRASLELLSLNKIVPGVVASSLKRGFALLGYLQFYQIEPLCPLLVLEMVRR